MYWQSAVKALILMVRAKFNCLEPKEESLPGSEYWLNVLIDPTNNHMMADSINELDKQLTLISCLLKVPALVKTLYDWFCSVLQRLIHLFKPSVIDEKTASDLAPLLEKIISLNQDFLIHKEVTPDNLIAFCEAQQASLLPYEPPSFSLEEAPSVFGFMTNTSFFENTFYNSFTGRQRLSEIDEQLKGIDESLETLNTFGMLAFNLAILKATNEAGGLQPYIDAYVQTQKKGDAWSESVFAYRMSVEKKHQKSKDYLDILTYLDSELLEKQEKRQVQEDRLLNILSENNGDLTPYAKHLFEKKPRIYEGLSKASECFKQLNSVIRKIKGPTLWAEQSCYFIDQHEKDFDPEFVMRGEMVRTNFYPLSWNLKTHLDQPTYKLSIAHTLVDKAIDLLEELLPPLKKRALKFHPDKNKDIPEVATYASAVFDEWRKRGEHVYQMYTCSKFYKKIDDEQPLDDETYRRHPAFPQNALNLDALAMHANYLEDFETRTTFHKSCRTVNSYSLFHDGVSPWLRGFYESSVNGIIDSNEKTKKAKERFASSEKQIAAALTDILDTMVEDKIESYEEYSIPITFSLLEGVIPKLIKKYTLKVNTYLPKLLENPTFLERATADMWYKFSQAGEPYTSLIDPALFAQRTLKPSEVQTAQVEERALEKVPVALNSPFNTINFSLMRGAIDGGLVALKQAIPYVEVESKQTLFFKNNLMHTQPLFFRQSAQPKPLLAIKAAEEEVVTSTPGLKK